MNQYIVTFASGYTDIVEAKTYKLEGDRATFDLGGGHDYILLGVEKVELAKSEAQA